MNYIDSTLMKNEVVLYRTKPHWIIFAAPFLWFMVAVGLFIFGPNINTNNYRFGTIPIYAVAALITLGLATLMAIVRWIVYQTSEYGVTNKRVLMKVGFIRRLSLEVFLRRIESVKIYQGIFGRIFGYGSIIISGVGGSKDPFINIPRTLEFRKKIQEQIEIAAE